MLLAVIGILVAVGALFQAPDRLSTLSQRTVKVAVITGTPAELTSALAQAPRVKVLRVRSESDAAAGLDSGKADASVSALTGVGAGVRIESAGIFGEVASKTVASIAYRQALGTDTFKVVEVRDKTHGQLLGLLLPTLLTMTLLTSAFGLAAGSLGSLRSSGMLLRLRSAGVTAVPLLAALITANLMLAAGAVALLVTVAASVTATTPQPLALIGTALLGYVLLASSGLLLASRFKNAQNASAASSFVLGLLALPALVPVPNLTGSTAKLAVTSTPTGALTEAFRSALNGADAQSLPVLLLIVSAWTVALTLLAARLFRWENNRG